MGINDFRQIVVSGIVFLVVAQVINTITVVFTMSYYTDPAYFALWSKLMMPSNGPPGTEFYLDSNLIDFIIGIIFACAYSLLKDSIPGNRITKGFNYGILLFLVAGVPFTLTTFLLLSVPVPLLLYWAISNLVIYLISGAAFAKIMAEKV